MHFIFDMFMNQIFIYKEQKENDKKNGYNFCSLTAYINAVLKRPNDFSRTWESCNVQNIMQ